MKVYYDKQTMRFFKIMKSEKTKRPSGIKDTFLLVNEYVLDYDKNELIEKDSGNMWLSYMKEDYSPMTKVVYNKIADKSIELHGEKMRYLFKIEI